ncbi:MAG: NADP-dependent malic enzyme [Anaerococcus hydrogenalis]|uniref:NAD(P)-dependent malic enzyme n=1 Tax=Anaerococcus hydrogenalis TaxID=33029 RepID=UPI002905437E|nr:NADP-dependent malic enzyme [Anaerococcus hydrogenalis]MDU2583459.1 NADP-dependent malic enzyme [Anaerococcus hydrogenalis]
MENLKEKALELHKEIQGKISTELKTKLESKDDLSLVYSPGVAEPCKKIHENEDDAYVYTGKANTIAVISDGTAVLGLGDIGPKAALPVMEGKACLFKKFGGLNAVPLVIDTTDTEEIIKFVKQVAPTFGGVNLEDISSPRCIEIETRLKEELDIPVFHDDQHGTAIVTIAALINSLKLVDKKPEDCNVVISGVGAAGSSIVRMLNDFGINDIYAFNSRGILKEGEEYSKDLYNKLAKETNKENKDLTLEEAMADADIFVGVSVPNKVSKEMVKSMRRDPIVLAMANPDPEITYEDAKEAGAKVVGTGRSDYPNQVNNVLAFPGLFKGALSVHATKITEKMKVAAAEAIASLIPDDKITEDYVIPSAFDMGVADVVAESVAKCAREEGISQK